MNTVFDLHKLGWNAFQQLCLTIVREVFGWSVQSFVDSHDGGRDGAFEGHWSKGPDPNPGAYVVQCKFVAKPHAPLRMTDLKDEFSKAGRLAAAGRCDNYILMTNALLSGRMEERLHERFLQEGVTRFLCCGYTWLCDAIREHKRLRLLVPRIYGLGDLSQILDERAYDQADREGGPSRLWDALGPIPGSVARSPSQSRPSAALSSRRPTAQPLPHLGSTAGWIVRRRRDGGSKDRNEGHEGPEPGRLLTNGAA